MCLHGGDYSRGFVPGHKAHARFTADSAKAHELAPEREAVVAVTAHIEDGSPRKSLTTLIDDEILSRL